jgi:hypothetical protein
MSYEAIMLALQELQGQLNRNNYREIKPSLIDIQHKIGDIACTIQQKTELQNLTQELFEIIKEMQAEDRLVFEQEAAENYELLKRKVIEAIEFTQTHIDSHDEVWQKLIDTQQLFKGKKLVAEQRDQLFGTVQKLFEILKKRRGDTVDEKALFHGRRFNKPEDQVDFVVSQCKKAEIDTTWAIMLQTKDKVMNLKLHPDMRKKLIDKLQAGFDILKQRREESLRQQSVENDLNAQAIKEMLLKAGEEMEKEHEFKYKWDLLLSIQNEFKSRKLEKDSRNLLYDELQAMFKKLNTEQYDDHSDFEKQADENYNHLNELVSECLKEAQSNKDLKRTKAYLIKVQADFKGRKMRSFEREKLFARLQSAFSILNKRIEEHDHSHKEQVPHLDKRHAELEVKIQQLEQGLEKDQQELEKYEGYFNEIPKGLETAENLRKKLDALHSAMAVKNAQLKILNQERERLIQNKGMMEPIE